MPNADHLRDVVVHFDAYERGEGRNQAAKGPTGFDPYYWYPGATVVLNLGDHELDVSAAFDAADELFNVLLRVAHPSVEDDL